MLQLVVFFVQTGNGVLHATGGAEYANGGVIACKYSDDKQSQKNLSGIFPPQAVTRKKWNTPSREPKLRLEEVA